MKIIYAIPEKNTHCTCVAIVVVNAVRQSLGARRRTMGNVFAAQSRVGCDEGGLGELVMINRGMRAINIAL